MKKDERKQQTEKQETLLRHRRKVLAWIDHHGTRDDWCPLVRPRRTPGTARRLGRCVGGGSWGRGQALPSLYGRLRRHRLAVAFCCSPRSRRTRFPSCPKVLVPTRVAAAKRRLPTRKVERRDSGTKPETAPALD